MEAFGQPLRFLCSEGILEIPFFQRPYVWNINNWSELLDDLLTHNGNHFLGSIILKHSKLRTGQAKKAMIIDGQQRITTLSILIKALYDCIEKKNSMITSIANSALFYTELATDSDWHISLRPAHNDYKAYEEVIGFIEDDKLQSPIIDKLDQIIEDKTTGKQPNKILLCYKFFYEKLKSCEQDTILRLWASLFDEANKIMVVIDLEDEDQEQEIFDTINSSGIKLTSTDIIKNALYQRLIELTDNREKVSEYYKETWEKTFELDEDTLNYWNAEKTTGRLKRQNSELLLQAVSVITGIFSYDNKEHTFTKLPDLYKDHILKLNVQELKDFISKIIDYADIYKNHIFDFNGHENFVYNNDDLFEIEKRLALILDKNDISTLNPYIIYLFKEFKDDESILKERLIDIEKLVMKYLITKNSIKNFNKDCSSFISDPTGNIVKEKINSIPNIDLKNGITNNVTNKLGNVILFWIELHRHNTDDKYDRFSLQYSYQLEHIMPQKWEKNWLDVDYVDEEGNILEKNTENRRIRYSKIYSLGNMTLLNGRLNASISNNNFIKKMEGEGKYKGVKHYSSLSITKNDIVENIYEKGNKVWNEQTIADREKKLAEEVIQLWGN